MRKLGAMLLAAMLLAGGSILVALAGLLVMLLTEPFYPFWPFFLPLAIGIALLAAHLAARMLRRLFPDHPERRRWTRIAWALIAVVLGLVAWGVGDLLTGPMHWQ